MAASFTTLAAVLRHAAENGLNALLVGKHGVGKTAIVKQCFDKMGWNWKYFSASTIDPWVDLVGVPKEINGKLELVRPASLDFENLEAIFLDEYNRAPKKVRNAVMELIQFGSINGKKFPNLKVVFAAINPDDDEDLNYDVDKLDPAQVDRFQLHVPVPYEPCSFYFKNTFGHVGTVAVKWWGDLKPDMKDLVSPRRLEAICKMFKIKGDLTYIVDSTKINVTELREALSSEDPTVTCDRLLTLPKEEVQAFFKDNNALKRIRMTMTGKARYLKKLVPMLPEAELMVELRNKKGGPVIKFVCNNVKLFKHIIPYVLGNKAGYSGQVVQAFEAYNKQNGGINTADTAARTITVDGVETEMAKICMGFTGSMGAGMERDKLQKLVKDNGGTVSQGITFATTHVVVGKSPGAKLVQAQKQGCVIITESEFREIINQLQNPTSELLGFTKDGSPINLDDLTLDNYKDRTGQRFRMEKWDKENGMTRNQAFNRHIESLKAKASV